MPRPNKGPQLLLKSSRGSATKRYFIVWYDRGQRYERSTGTDNRELAHRKFAEFLAEQTRRPGGPSHPDDITVASLLTLYGKEHAPHVADPARIGHCIKALLPYWGALPVSAIKAETCRAYTRDRQVSDGTVRRELACLRAAIGYAYREGYLLHAPAVTLPPRPDSRSRWLTREEAVRLLWAARSEPKSRLYLPLFILIGLLTAARRDAILTLQWQPNTQGGYVDLEHGFIDFAPVGRRQTKKRRTRIPIPRRLMVMLRLARQRTTQYVIEHNGKPVKLIRRSFASACKRAGLSDVVPHTLRHTSITWMVQGGVKLWDVADYAGITIEMISRVYGHHAPDHLHAAREALDRRQPTRNQHATGGV